MGTIMDVGKPESKGGWQNCPTVRHIISMKFLPSPKSTMLPVRDGLVHKLLEPLSWSTHKTEPILLSLLGQTSHCKAPSCVCMAYIPVYELRAGAELPSDGGSLLPKHDRWYVGPPSA